MRKNWFFKKSVFLKLPDFTSSPSSGISLSCLNLERYLRSLAVYLNLSEQSNCHRNSCRSKTDFIMDIHQGFLLKWVNHIKVSSTGLRLCEDSWERRCLECLFLNLSSDNSYPWPNRPFSSSSKGYQHRYFILDCNQALLSYFTVSCCWPWSAGH